MAKSRSFSIYLLKPGFNSTNCLKEDHSLELLAEKNNQLPENSVTYTTNRPTSPPWWKGYWGIEKPLFQSQQGALIFIPISNNWLALTFGMTHHCLLDNSYEYDFGIRTTLNALDPEKIKSTDILEPESAKRERIQSPTASNLTFFDIKYDETIVKKLTGAVKEEFQDILSNVTGASSLKITSRVEPEDILNLCNRLLNIYVRNDYQTTFPDIQNIVPVKDPDKLVELNQLLLEAFVEAPVDLVLTIPEIIDHTNTFSIKYTGAGRSNLEYQDIYIGNYRQYLEDRQVAVIESVSDFKKHQLNILDENGQIVRKFSIYNCFLFDCESNNNHFHLCEGEWYQIDNDYLEKLRTSLDPYFISDHDFLNECHEVRESQYNQRIATENTSVICLDEKNIAPNGQYEIEPCDLLNGNGENIDLIHVKISTRSSTLSHLFNQGYNSVHALRMLEESRDKLKNLVDNDLDLSISVDGKKYAVVYGIISKKKPTRKSKNLPIFSRISLMRIVNGFNLLNVQCSIYFIKDNVDRRTQNNTQ